MVNDDLAKYLRIPRTYKELKDKFGENNLNRWRRENQDRIRVVNLPSTWYLLGWHTRDDLTLEQRLNYLRLSVSNQYNKNSNPTPKELARYLTMIARWCDKEALYCEQLETESGEGSLDE
jgi:hypothetical protein